MPISGFVSTVWQDIRYAVRVLVKGRAVTAVAVVSLALGIGATTSIFSVVYGVLISPYPYARPGEIWSPAVRNAKNPNQGRATYKGAEVLQMRELPAFSMVAASQRTGRVLLEAFHYRFHNVIRRAEALLAAETIGPITRAAGEFHAPIPRVWAAPPRPENDPPAKSRSPAPAPPVLNTSIGPT